MNKNNTLFKYFILFSMMFVSAVNYNLFLRPLKIVAGGTNGLSIIVEDIFSISPSVFIFVFQFIILIIAYFVSGKVKASSALVATIVYPILVYLTEPIFNNVTIGEENYLIASIFSGVLTGVVSGYICKVDLSQGGIILIAQMIYDKFKISISKINLIINIIIIGAGWYCFGVNSVLCAVILLFVNSIVIDKIILGISDNKAYYIITRKPEEMSNYFIEELNTSYTIFDADDDSKNFDKTMIMLVIPNNMYYKVAKRIKIIDKDVFFVATDSYQVVCGNKM